MNLSENNFFKIFILLMFLGLGFGFSKLYQPYGKTVRIYKQALKDYENQNYSNSYYLFGKIGYLSNLKPVAIYRQAMCAKALGDRKSELNRYEFLNKNYPKHRLTPKSKYYAGQLLQGENPHLALKYFNQVLKSELPEDYKTASNYYIAKIEARKAKFDKDKLAKQLPEIENHFRKYLEEVPDGRLASEVGQTWRKLNPDTNSKDSVLIARTFYMDKNYNETAKILEKTQTKDNWAVKSLNLTEKKDYKQAEDIIKEGIEKYSEDVNYDDLKSAIDTYINLQDTNRIAAADNLLAIAQKSAKDYITYNKCSELSGEKRFQCFNNLYANSYSDRYKEEALLEVFKYNLQKRNYAQCKNTAAEFASKYPKSPNIPMIKFWIAKIKQYKNDPECMNDYNHIIEQYPDTYYAYRSFWIIKGIQTSVINAVLEYKGVEYPYKYPAKNSTMYNLIEVGDYSMLSEFINDEFIESWGEYKKGNYAKSMVIATKAMEKIYPKPPKTDLRWRLVYPQNYFKQILANAKKYNNNETLIISLIRAESSFNSEAQSSVGAIGLMQLMPSTAHETGEKYGMDFNTSYLFNPELNIKLGNLYYSGLKQSQKNDLYAIASYNGGAGAVEKWKKTLKYSDTDEFVEQIPYDETANYVKKVFGNYWNYLKIYQKN